jgi:hypothetical protein|nr:MAG TPA: penicillin-binding protein [Caudoviricetes sp.]
MSFKDRMAEKAARRRTFLWLALLYIVAFLLGVLSGEWVWLSC